MVGGGEDSTRRGDAAAGHVGPPFVVRKHGLSPGLLRTAHSECAHLASSSGRTSPPPFRSERGPPPSQFQKLAQPIGRSLAMTTPAFYLIESNSAGYAANVISAAKTAGLRTHFLTRDKTRTYSNALISPLTVADTVSEIDTNDVICILNALAHDRPIGICTFDDFHIIQTAAVAAALDLPYATLPENRK